MKQRYFITSTGTGIGKSFITAALVQQAKALGQSVAAYKPVISGFDPAQPQDSDTGLILQSLGLPITTQTIERISPFRYAAPLAPSIAGRQEKCPLDFDALVAHGRQSIDGKEDIVLIEGVGGVMVPLNDSTTVLDWMIALNIPVILVVGTYLGSISHTLTALEILQQRKIHVHALLVNESENSSVPLTMTSDELKIWTDAQMIQVERQEENSWHQVVVLQKILRKNAE